MQIDAAHAALTSTYPLQSRKLKGPDDADDLKQQCLAFDRLMSFDAKHALQNASIVGEWALAVGLSAGPPATPGSLPVLRACVSRWAFAAAYICVPCAAAVNQ